MNRLGLVGAALLLATTAAAQTTFTSAPADGTHLRRLVAQLDSDSYDERQAAQEALLGMGEAVSPALEAALKDKTLGPEGVFRAKFILARVGTPEFGAGFRGWPNLATPEGIEEGDVVVAVGDQPVRTTNDLAAGLKAGSSIVTVWRKGRGNQQVELADRQAVWGFRPWQVGGRRSEIEAGKRRSGRCGMPRRAGVGDSLIPGTTQSSPAVDAFSKEAFRRLFEKGVMLGSRPPTRPG